MQTGCGSNAGRKAVFILLQCVAHSQVCSCACFCACGDGARDMLPDPDDGRGSPQTSGPSTRSKGSDKGICKVQCNLYNPLRFQSVQELDLSAQLNSRTMDHNSHKPHKKRSGQERPLRNLRFVCSRLNPRSPSPASCGLASKGRPPPARTPRVSHGIRPPLRRLRIVGERFSGHGHYAMSSSSARASNRRPGRSRESLATARNACVRAILQTGAGQPERAPGLRYPGAATP